MGWDANNNFDDATTEEVEEDLLEPEAEEAIEISDAPAAAKKRPARKRTASTGQLTKAQVSAVLETFQDVQDASDDATDILKVVLRDADADHSTLTALILGADRADNPLAALAELRSALEENPFVAAATLAGMERGRRARAYATLQAATGATDTLSAKDIEAAAAFAGALSALTDDEALALDEAHEILGK